MHQSGRFVPHQRSEHTFRILVVGAELHTLATLIATSLLQRTADGRYTLHELLRQFGEEKLAADAEAQQRTRDCHSDFVLQFMQQRM